MSKYKLNEAALIHEIKKINVTKPERKGAFIDNPTDLPVISREKKRAVIGINQTRCAVYFTDEEKAQKEFQALQMGAKLGITPKVYGTRGTYVVMERIDAPTLAQYLTKHTLTKELTQKLLDLLNNFQKAGYTKMDHKPEYIYLMPDGSLKVVNVYRHTKLPEKQFPKRMIKNMGKQVTLFLQYVKELNPSMYTKWAHHPEFAMTVQKAKFGKRK
jgi:RIO-like serine/threonine protein kinase